MIVESHYCEPDLYVLVILHSAFLFHQQVYGKYLVPYDQILYQLKTVHSGYHTNPAK